MGSAHRFEAGVPLMLLTRLRDQFSERDEKPTPAAHVEDVIILVPGFLGFDHFGGFFYFADRVCGALRGALEVKLGRPGRVPVMPATTRPTASLRECQRSLIRFLSKILDQFPNTNLHLVGHSTGGVHAQLLTSARPQGGGSWSDDAVRCRARIRSVISIAAPHWGSHLAYSDLASLARLDFGPQVLKVGPPLYHLLRLTLVESAFSALDLTVATAVELWSFLLDIGKDRGLIEALTPKYMAGVRQADSEAGPGLPVRHRSFVSVALNSNDSDPFFRDLHTRTGKTDAGARSPVAEAAAERLNHEIHLHASGRAQRPCRVIKSARIAELDITEASNDGIVNSVHQLVDPSAPEELAGIVVADHADVIGHYDRWELRALAGSESIDWSRFKRGLFRSGSRFRDEQFFELYAAVADELLPAITTSVSRSASGGSGGGDRARAPSPSAPPPADS